MSLRSLTVLVPVHNEEKNIQYFYSRALPTLSGLVSVSWKIVFLNNASTDSTLNEILDLRNKDPRVKVLTLSRNVGYQCSLLAGLTTLDSDLYAIVDGDCEDPPELLKQFYTAIESGGQTVYGIRSHRDEPRLITWGRGLFYWINRSIADGPITPWMAEFSMFTRPVRDAILSNRSTFPFLRAEMSNVGLSLVGIPYFRESRKKGASHYNFFRMTEFAIAGFLSSSTFPLRSLVYLSPLFGVGLIAVPWLGGWTLEKASALAALGAAVYLLVSVPVLALYIARGYKNTVARPVFFIDPQKTHVG